MNNPRELGVEACRQNLSLRPWGANIALTKDQDAAHGFGLRAAFKNQPEKTNVCTCDPVSSGCRGMTRDQAAWTSLPLWI